jgi:hypothetical protein
MYSASARSAQLTHVLYVLCVCVTQSCHMPTRVEIAGNDAMLQLQLWSRTLTAQHNLFQSILIVTHQSAQSRLLDI